MKIGIITGASAGMGKWFAYYAKRFQTDLQELWLIGRNEARLEAVARRIAIPCRIIVMDLTSAKDVKELQAYLSLRQPEIRLVVNNAGLGYIGPFTQISIKDQEEIISLNCMAFTQILHMSIPFMRSGAHIINLASAAAFMPQAEFAVYAASKSYVLSLSNALRQELRKRKIKVTAVCPGPVNTAFFDKAEKYQIRKFYKNIFLYKERAVVLQAYEDAYKGKRISVHGFCMKAFYLIRSLFSFM